MSDLIDRQAAIDVVCGLMHSWFEDPKDEVREINQELGKLPSAQPEWKKGKWIESNDTIIRGTCSCCGWNAITAETDVVGMPFCPNCGAAMDGYEAAKKLCPRCHTLYLQASTQCPACGWLEHYPKH